MVGLSWLVDVDFRRSALHGIGVFADKPIAAGTRIWQVDRSMHVADAATLAALRPADLRLALHGGYLHKPSDLFLWYSDGMQFMNHRPAPGANIGLGFWPKLEEDHTIALRDIAAGEELFEDYGFWSDCGIRPDHWLYALYRDYCPEHLSFLTELETARRAA